MWVDGWEKEKLLRTEGEGEWKGGEMRVWERAVLL